MSIAEFEVLDEYSLTNITASVRSACVLVALQPTCELTSILHKLSQAFKNESSASIGVLKQSDGSSITWENSRSLDMVDQEDLAFFPRKLVDRTCLIRPSWQKPPKAERYYGSRTLQELLAFINAKCGTFRQLDGSLLSAGLARKRIIDHLYRVPNSDGPSHASYSGPVNIGSTCERIPLPSKEKFFHEYFFRSKPVVITGALKNWPAMKKWTTEFLTTKFGDKMVRVAFAPYGEYEGCEKAHDFEDFKDFKFPDVVKSQLPFPDLVVVRPAFLEIPFSTFMSILQSSNDSNISAYLEYSSIPSLLPELEQDIKEMPFLSGELKRRHLNIWLSNGNTLGKLHFDPFDNFLCQISGKKQLFIYEPHDNTKLYEAHIQEATLDYNAASGKFRRKKLLESTSMVMSPVDILNPDYHRFPKFKEARALNCTINEGDVLFMPSFWWHEVQSYPSREEPRNVAVNFWYEPFLTKEFPCATCKMDVNSFYHHMLDP